MVNLAVESSVGFTLQSMLYNIFINNQGKVMSSKIKLMWDSKKHQLRNTGKISHVLNNNTVAAEIQGKTIVKRKINHKFT